MPLAAGNLRKSGKYRVKRARIFFEDFLFFPDRVPRYYLALNVEQEAVSHSDAQESGTFSLALSRNLS